MWDVWDIDWYYCNSVDDFIVVLLIEVLFVNGVVQIVVVCLFLELMILQMIFFVFDLCIVLLCNEVDWYEMEKLFKFVFLFDIQVLYIEVEMQFGYQVCVIYMNISWEVVKFEILMYCFVLVCEQDFGVVFVNDLIYGYDMMCEVGEDGVIMIVWFLLLWVLCFFDLDMDYGFYEIEVGFVIGVDVVIVMVEGICINSLFLVICGVCEVELLVLVQGEGIVVLVVKFVDDGFGDVVVCVYEVFGCCVVGELLIGFDYCEVCEVSLIEDDIDDVCIGGEL